MWKPMVTATAALACLLSETRAEAPKLDLDAADNLRALLVEAMPDPLVDEHSHRGGQAWLRMAWSGTGQGLRLHPDLAKTLRNDGRWWKVKASDVRLPDTLIVALRDLRTTASGPTTFIAFVSFEARMEYDQQNWDRGLRFYAASVEARMRLNLMLHCEATTRLVSNGTLLPDAIFRLA